MASGHHTREFQIISGRVSRLREVHTTQLQFAGGYLVKCGTGGDLHFSISNYYLEFLVYIQSVKSMATY